jgi:two-component sensor histidine kinase
MGQPLSLRLFKPRANGRGSVGLVHAQKEALERALAGEPLDDVLNLIVRSTAAQADGRAAIFLVDEAGAFLRFSAASGLPESYTRAVDGFLIGPTSPSCGNAAYTGERVVVSDVCKDPLWQPFLALAEKHGIRACWSTPIRNFEGEVLGTLAVYHATPRQPKVCDLEAIDLLAHTASLLIGRARAERAREAALEHARSSEVAALEMSHRIMNSFQVLQRLVVMQAKVSPGAEVRGALDSISARLFALAAMHRLLLRGLRENLETIDLADYLPELVGSVDSAFISGDSLTLEVDVESGARLPAGQVSAFGLIATELMMNALKHASPDGRQCRVVVSFRELGELRRLTVSDDGVGLPPEAGQPKAAGLGMKLINSLAGQLRGSVEVNRTPPGVCFQLTFPVLETSQPWTRSAETITLHAPAYG